MVRDPATIETNRYHNINISEKRATALDEM
jgi:hypothetical protein